MRITISATLVYLMMHSLLAGDAVVIGYAEDGAWAAVTYNRSSTPRGGQHYHNSAQACAFALRDLQSRASDVYLARTEVVGRSDETGYVTVAQGKAIRRSKEVTAIGRGKSQNDADRNALNKLVARDATTEAQIVYRYFSYGDDSGSSKPGKSRGRRTNQR